MTPAERFCKWFDGEDCGVNISTRDAVENIAETIPLLLTLVEVVAVGIIGCVCALFSLGCGKLPGNSGGGDSCDGPII